MNTTSGIQNNTNSETILDICRVYTVKKKPSSTEGKGKPPVCVCVCIIILRSYKLLLSLPESDCTIFLSSTSTREALSLLPANLFNSLLAPWRL